MMRACKDFQCVDVSYTTRMPSVQELKTRHLLSFRRARVAGSRRFDTSAIKYNGGTKNEWFVYFRRSMYMGSPSTTLVRCRNEPVNDINRPPKDAYTVLLVSQ